MMNKIQMVCMVAGMMLATVSCTKYDTPLPVAEDGSVSKGGVAGVKSFVLWINIDGAGGGDLAKNAFPDDGTVKGMLPKSVYLWSGLEANHIKEGDVVTDGAENPIASASLLTGNTPYRHGVEDNSYISEKIYDPDFDESLKDYNSFFQYIKDHDKSIKTLAVTPWNNQNKNLLYDATYTVTTQNDEETQARVLKALQEEDNRVIYLSYKDVLGAAVSGGGWNESNSAYKEAMQKVDGRIGELMAALKARPDAWYEDWLVIVTSNHGGKADGTYGGNSAEERNMFGIFYYEHFSNPQEMKGETVDAFRWDHDFTGTVIDSITRQNWNGLPVARNRQVYSMDTIANEGLTVQVIMSTRPSDSRSYVGVTQKGGSYMKKGKWDFGLNHTYSASYGKFYGITDNQNDGLSFVYGDFADPYIHSYMTTLKLHSTVDHADTIKGEEDDWGVLQPDKYNWKRLGYIDMACYYDGVRRGNGVSQVKLDWNVGDYRDNANLEILNGMRWSCRYFLELRIWNKMLDATAARRYSDQLMLTPENCPDYNNLIGYWEFYKGENGQYILDDSLVVNQIKEITKRDGTKVPGEPIRIRKKDPTTNRYVPIGKEDVRYEQIPVSLFRNMLNGKRVMESATVLPVILNWLDISYPQEFTRDSKDFWMSKIDGVWHALDTETKRKMWRYMLLGDDERYKLDFEWRYEN